LLSIPRDLYVPLAGYNEQQRINSAYYWGEINHLPGGGPGYAEQVVTYNFGVPVQRYAVINFEGFQKIVDAVGGVDVDVPHEILDYEYPTPIMARRCCRFRQGTFTWTAIWR
jgi:LCP family protein required for cell wall assembly